MIYINGSVRRDRKRRHVGCVSEQERPGERSRSGEADLDAPVATVATARKPTRRVAYDNGREARERAHVVEGGACGMQERERGREGGREREGVCVCARARVRVWLGVIGCVCAAYPGHQTMAPHPALSFAARPVLVA